jgi:hypothetical protein
MAKYKTVFFAYPAKPPHVGETIEAASKLLNKKWSRQVRIRTWTQLSIVGRAIIDQIMKAISEADIFACDLTYPNPNVLFELGYAVGTHKRLWIALDPTVSAARETFRHLNSTLLPDVGYVTYENPDTLTEQFVSTKPWEDTQSHLLGSGFDTKAKRPSYPSLYYLKQPIDTYPSVRLTEALQDSFFSQGLFTDNPKDNPSSTLLWYAEKIRDSDAVVVHLLSPEHEGHESHNLRCAFVAGLGLALTGHVLLLAPAPYETPLDYRNMLQVHRTADECHRAITQWLADTEARLPRRRARYVTESAIVSPRLDLKDLRIGEYVAEYEQASLEDYFIPTDAFYTALDCEEAFLVGRRGTGKTANLFALAQEFAKSPGIHVCIVKPVGYEVDGIIRVLDQIVHKAERGYLLESLWKLLVYTELAQSVADEVKNRRSEQAHLLTQQEVALLGFVGEHEYLCGLPFSLRIERAITPLLEIGTEPNVDAQRARISEALHVGLIRELRMVIGDALSGRQKVAILIDNLDEPWAPGTQLAHLADLLLGLLRVAKDIGEDLRHADRLKRAINASMIVFMRSDIFYHVQRTALEQDKLPIQILHWGDRELLLRVIAERLENAAQGRLSAKEIWRTMFPEIVAEMPLTDFVTAYTLPRPRDLIYMVREAIAAAVNREHSVVTEEDLFSARRRYSEFAFRSILAEDDPGRGKLESVLFEFAGAKQTMTRSETERTVAAAGLNDVDIDFYINLLCDLNFLGIESADGFVYARHEGERSLWRNRAKRAAIKRRGEGAEELYEINRAFHDVLEIR